MQVLRKSRIQVTAAYKNGTVLKKDHEVPARVAVLTIPGAPDKFRELSIRLVVDTNSSEELLEGLAHGTVSLNIEGMLTPVERASK